MSVKSKVPLLLDMLLLNKKNLLPQSFVLSLIEAKTP